jgi:hypothetical protein
MVPLHQLLMEVLHRGIFCAQDRGGLPRGDGEAARLYRRAANQRNA